MSGRHGKKKKKQHALKGVIDAASHETMVAEPTSNGQRDRDQQQAPPLTEQIVHKPQHDTVTVLSVAIAGIVAAIYFFQWQAQIRAMKIDERAWVSVDVGEKTGTFSVTMHNTGKTPALNVT
jgi:hypothetical protein